MTNKNKKIILDIIFYTISSLSICYIIYQGLLKGFCFVLEYNNTPYILEVPRHRVKEMIQVQPAKAAELDAPKYAHVIRGVQLNDKQLATANKILAIADKEDFKWKPYLIELAYCESKLGEIAVNDKGNTPPSRDRGVFQINDYWHKDISDDQAFDVEFATKWTMNMVNKGYQHRWACDKLVLNNNIKIEIVSAK